MNLQEWRDGAEGLLEMKREVDTSILSFRKDMCDKIRYICEKNGLNVESVDGSLDLSEFIVILGGDSSNSIHLSRRFVAEIGMGVSVKRAIDSKANQILFLEIYPFEKLEED